MADAVSICNLALSYLGDAASVASIDPPDDSPQARYCAVFYPNAVSALLDMFDWSFATKYATLSKYSNLDKHGWQGVYAVPGDCIRAIRVRPSEVQHFLLTKGAEFEIANDAGRTVLYTDADQPVLSYITSNVNTSVFSPSFTIALAWYLANMIAGARVKGKEGFTMSQNIMKQFDLALRQAKVLDARQQKKRIRFIPGQIEVR